MDPNAGSANSNIVLSNLPLPTPQPTPGPGNSDGMNQEKGLGTAGPTNKRTQNVANTGLPTPQSTPGPDSSDGVNPGGLKAVEPADKHVQTAPTELQIPSPMPQLGNGSGPDKMEGAKKRKTAHPPTDNDTAMEDSHSVLSEQDNSPTKPIIVQDKPNSNGPTSNNSGGAPIEPSPDHAIDKFALRSRNCGASVPLSTAKDCIGHVHTGMIFEALVQQGATGQERYRLVPSKAVIGPTGQGIDLIKTQRAVGSSGENATFKREHFRDIVAVAWRDKEVNDFHPVAAMIPRFGIRFPVTRVKVLWQDDETSWETRSSLRKFFPKETIDKMIYSCAREAEIRYRKGQNLPDLNIIELTIEHGKSPSKFIGGPSTTRGSTSIGGVTKTSTTSGSVPGTNTRTGNSPPTTGNSTGGVTILPNTSTTPGNVGRNSLLPTTESNSGFSDAQLSLLNSMFQNAIKQMIPGLKSED